MSGRNEPQGALPQLKPGDSLQLAGRVVELYQNFEQKPDGTGLVNFPTSGGALLGVRLSVPADAKLGDLVTVAADVSKVEPGVVSVTVKNVTGDMQPVDVEA